MTRWLMLPIGLVTLVVLTGMGSRPPNIDGPAPLFETTDVEGRPVALADYRGKVVLLNFWATWCEPCKKEMPEMQAAYERLKDHGFVVLAINFGETPDSTTNFAHHGRLTFPILLDRKVAVAASYGVVNLPVSFFIDQNGMIRERVFGGTLTAASIEQTVAKIRADHPPSSPPHP